MMPRFRKFQGRLLFFFLGLFILVQAAAFSAVQVAITENAESRIKEDLLVGGRVFDRVFTARSVRLAEIARLLSGDYGFKAAVSDEGDRPTLLSAMNNHAARVKADVMMLVSLDRTLIADTRNPRARPSPFPLPGLIEIAEDSGEAVSTEFINGRLYRVVVVPLLAPAPVAWICMGFAVNDALAEELRQLTGLEVTFITEQGGKAMTITASTLSPDLRQSLAPAMLSASWAPDGIAVMAMQGGHYLSLARPLRTAGQASIKAFLQRSREEALQPFYRLRWVLLALFIGGLAITLAGGVLIARTVSKPVRLLAAGAQSIEQGDYGSIVALDQRDELGSLASAFNTMAGAIAQREERIKHQAYHDTLTGLPNRAYLQMRLDKDVSEARELDHPLALIMMDINRFKDVNAALGHMTGDIILQKVGALLVDFSPAASVVARVGGEEFAVLLPAGEGAEEAVRTAQNIAERLETPLLIDGNPIPIEASFGIAIFPVHGADGGSLISRSETAMHLAKGSTAGYSVYSPELDRHIPRQLALLGELRRAIALDEMIMYYQPKVDFVSGRISGAEALMRWRHPQQGLIEPDDFIPMLERTAMILPITLWTLTTAIGQCARLNRDGIFLNMAINISARMLQDQQLPEKVANLIDRHGVPPGQITLEVTESAIMGQPERSMDVIRRLDKTGVRLSIDDFGTGYSSLSYLQRLPMDELKIDKSFVLHMDTNAGDAAIVHSTILLAHSLGMKVTAEGVENGLTWDMLKTRGCDVAQGYLMSRPIPVEQILIWIKDAKWGLGLEQVAGSLNGPIENARTYPEQL